MLGRAQEIEHLERESKAQVMIADEARATLIRMEAAYTDAAQRLQSVRREASEAQTRAHELHVELLRLSSQAEAATTRRTQLEDELAEIDAQDEGLIERRDDRRGALRGTRPATGHHAGAPGRPRRGRDHGGAQAVRRARAAARARAPRAGGAVQHARAVGAPGRAAARDRDGRAAGADQHAGRRAAHAGTRLRSTTRPPAPACRKRWTIRAGREAALAAVRTEYDELSMQLRKADEQRLEFERSLQPLRDSASPEAAARGAGRAAGRRAVPRAARRRPRSTSSCWARASRTTASSCTACRPRSTASAAR